MSKIEIFKKVLYEYIGCNDRLVEDLKTANKNKCLEIHLTALFGSSAHYDSYNDYYSVNIGLKEIPQIYNKSIDVSVEYDDDVLLDLHNCYSDYGNLKCILNVVQIHQDSYITPTPAEILNLCDFLHKERITRQDSITLLCFMFILYHELGHVIHDSSIERQLDKEYAADAYAYECIKSYCKGKDETLRKYIILSTIISISSFLLKRTAAEEMDDVEHPHSVERIYLFLQSMEVEEDSPIWEYSLRIIGDWCRDNNINEAVIKGEKCSYKTQMLELYDYFKK